MISDKQKRIGALALAVIMALMVAVPAVSNIVQASDDYQEEKERVDELNQKYKELQQQEKAINDKINSAKSEKEKQQAQKDQLIGQINVTTAQVDVLNARIEALELDIEEKEQEMETKQQEIEENFELLKKRVRAKYIAGGNTGSLGLVLGADDYPQFLMRSEVITRVAEHDQNLIERLTDERNRLKEIKEEIEEDKESVEQDKIDLDQKKIALDGQVQQAQNKIASLEDMEREFMADKENMQKQMKQMQAEIAAILAEINKTSTQMPYIGGGMAWPSATLSQISSGYGYRFNGSDFHTGIDITGPGAMGTPVLAANSGTVVVANTSFTPGVGYGKYVMIDHGGGVQTIYAHCSALNVSVGQQVVTGQKIAEVGSTGWSTGPHIHFEIRENGKSQNPTTWQPKS